MGVGLRDLVLLWGALASLAPMTAARAGAPNLLVISVDTLRADHSSAYGYERDTTPALSKLAAEGALFETAYAPVAQTGPAHASLFTGLYPARHGLLKNGLSLGTESHTLAEILAASGYQTAAIVSSFVLDPRFGLAQGFAEYQADFDPGTATETFETWEGQAVPAGFDRRADATTQRAIRWLWFDRDPKRPFFLFMHYFDPHAPYAPPEGFRGRFALSDPPSTVPKAFEGIPSYRKDVDRYDAEIAFTDHAIAALLEELERQQLLDQTLVLVTSDHGEGLLAHGVWFHGADVHEEAVRVPLILRLPRRIPAGRRGREPVSLVDVVPTLLDMLELDPPALDFDGHNLGPFLRGEASLEAGRPIFLYRRLYERPTSFERLTLVGEQHGVRAGRLKLIEHSTGGPDELYDLEEDPLENRNLHDLQSADAVRLGELLSARRKISGREKPVPELSDEVRRGLEALGYTD